MKYAWIEKNQLVWPVSVQCRVLEVSASGYRQHRARRKKIFTRRHLSETALVVEIRAVYAEARGAYGWPRVWRQLKAQGVRVGKRRVQRTMQLEGIRARGRRRFRVVTTDSNHALPVAPNLLARHFTVATPNTVWAGDMTYVPTEEGWLYLAVVLDLFSRRIVGWSMGRTIDAELACRALEMVWQQRMPDKGLIFHSDRGSQYASRGYAELLAGHGIRASMSRKGNCWDNACSETLFGSLKVDGVPHGLSTLLIGDTSIGQQLVDSPRVPLISATGSTAMGRAHLRDSLIVAKVGIRETNRSPLPQTSDSLPFAVHRKGCSKLQYSEIMPVVFRYRGFTFFFYSNEGTPREPVHIHVEKDNIEAKFWLRPEVRLAYNDGYDVRTLRELLEVIEANKDRIERAWNEFFR